MMHRHVLALSLTMPMLLAGCLSSEVEGLKPAPAAETTVMFDFYAKPLPRIPLPNDLATRFDADSPTGRRLNASLITPSQFNSHVRTLVDRLDGWGLFQVIQIPFTGPLDVQSILAAHRDDDYDFADDVVYLIDVTRDSPDFGRKYALDLGNGNYPQVLEKKDFWKNGPRNGTLSLLHEEGVDEDVNGNGIMDLGSPGVPSEDTDADGVLDKPNYIPGSNPDPASLAERADALMTFYEAETNTLLVKALVPLRQRTTYAVVVTRRLKDAAGNPVGSPFDFVHHAAQTEALKPLPEVLPEGTTIDDVAFAFSFTTQTFESDWVAVRDGLYGHGVQAHIGQDFEAKIDGLEELREGSNPYVLHTEEFIPGYEQIGALALGLDPTNEEGKAQIDSFGFIDYQVTGSYTSPQLFDRYDEAGNLNRWNDQSWPEDLDRVPAKTRGETVYFTLTMPRREVSLRGAGGQVPVVMVGHGYTGSRFDQLAFAGHFARHGIATIAIDNVSHGIGLTPEEESSFLPLLGAFGLGKWAEAQIKNRSWDQNGDGVKDSGADFWTTYLFHTRDVVRQSALDYMQLVRIIRSFDGERTWNMDVNADGTPELAGDFDGDGQVDIGIDSIIGMTGGSLGGMMSTYTGAIEPEIRAVLPIAAGGGLADMGLRSQQGGVREGFILRALCPLLVGTTTEDGDMVLETIVPDMNETAELAFATVKGVEIGDAVVVTNMTNGVVACANVLADGTWRTSLESDMGDEIKVVIYDGPALAGDTECGLRDGYSVRLTVDTVETAYDFQAKTYEVGQPLIAMAEGFGMKRGSPELRQMFAIGQLIIDRADMAVAAMHMNKDLIHYPGTNQSAGTHMLLLTTAGDMSVPASGGMAIARAADVLPYLENDVRYGKPANQVLIDTFFSEAAHNIGRYFDDAGNPVHIDMERLNGGYPYPWDGVGIPQIDEPLRLWGQDNVCDTGACGFSGALFPWPRPDGQHGFDFPGTWIDKGRKACAASCTETEGADPCGCMGKDYFDVGMFLFNVGARYLGSGGLQLNLDECNSFNTCSDLPVVPEPRDISTL